MAHDDRRILTERIGAAMRETVSALDTRLSGEVLDDFRVLVTGQVVRQ